MSYEPTIIVEVKDLEKHKSELTKIRFGKDDLSKKKIANYLLGVLDHVECRFKNLKLFVFQPEFSSFNQDVRNWLKENKIEFGEDN